MKRKIYLLFLLFFIFSYVGGQCYIDIISPSGGDTTIMPGDSVHLLADGDCNLLTDNRFLDGTIGAGWSSTGASPVFSNPCGRGLDSTYLWVSTTTDAPRIVETKDFGVYSTSCNIRWYMRYGAQPHVGPCKDPDGPDEGVELQFSTDSGASWTTFSGVNEYAVGQNYYTDNGGPPGDDFLGVTTTPGSGGQWHPHGDVSVDMYDSLPYLPSDANWSYLFWHEYENSMPPAAIAPQTRFRWVQFSNSGLGWDAWGIDRVRIDCPGNFSVAWSHGSQQMDGGVVSPATTTTYNVMILDTTGHSAIASVTIYVDSTITELSQQQSGRKHIQIYPNPGEGVFNLDIQDFPRGHVSVCVFNLEGQKIMCRELENSGDNGHTHTLDLSGQPKGMYLVRINGDDMLITKRTVIQ